MPIPVWIMDFPILDAGLAEFAIFILVVLIVIVLRSPAMIFRAIRDHIDTVSQLREMMEIADFWKGKYDKRDEDWRKLFDENSNIDAYGWKSREYADALLEAADAGLAQTPEWRQMWTSLKKIRKAYQIYNPNNPFDILSTEDNEQLYHLRQLHRLQSVLSQMKEQKLKQSETTKQIPA